MLLHRKYFSLEELVEYWRENKDKNATVADFIYASLNNDFHLYICPQFIASSMSKNREYAHASLGFPTDNTYIPVEGRLIASTPVVMLAPIGSKKALIAFSELGETDSIDLYKLADSENMALKDPNFYPVAKNTYEKLARDVIDHGINGLKVEVVFGGVSCNLLATARIGLGHSDSIKLFENTQELDAENFNPITITCSTSDLYVLKSEFLPVKDSLFSHNLQTNTERSSKTLNLVIALLIKEIKGSKRNSNQSRIIEDLIDKYGDLKGISKSNLEAVFSQANKELEKR